MRTHTMAAFAALLLAYGSPLAHAATLFATTNNGSLVRVESSAPNVLVSSVTLNGLQAGEALLGIDFRPATGQLYGFGSTGRLYRIDPVTGTATATGAPISPAITGQAAGFDFNPTADRIRLVTSAGEDLRLNPDTGAIAATDTTLAYAGNDPNNGKTPRVTAAAYTNSFASATTTTLYVIDTSLNVLSRQGSAGGTPTSPNTGQLNTIGPLGVAVSDVNGFDISRFGDAAFAALQPTNGGPTGLYSINLSTGAASKIGDFNSSLQITGLAILENTGSTGDCNLTGNPVISGLTEAAGYQNSLASGGLASVFLTGIATPVAGRLAGTSDLFNNRFPGELDCLAVEFNGQRAPVFYVSNGQVNVQVPNSVAGPTDVRVVLNPGRANEIRGALRQGVVVQPVAPAFFTFNGTSVAAQTTTFTPIGPPSVAPGARAARPGETIVVYGSGFGPTSPVFDAGSIPDRAAAITSPYTITIGGITLAPSDILYAGVSPSSISGLYQFNLRIPVTVASGEQPISISIGGLTTQPTAILLIGQ